MHRVKKIDLERVEVQRKLDHERRNPKSEDDGQASREAQRKLDHERRNAETEAESLQVKRRNVK